MAEVAHGLPTWSMGIHAGRADAGGGAHDAAGLVLDEGVVHGLERALRVHHGVKVDVCVTERTAADRVTADTDRCHGANGVEKLEQQGLGDLRVEVANVERGSGVGVHVFLFGSFFCSTRGKAKVSGSRALTFTASRPRDGRGRRARVSPCGSTFRLCDTTRPTPRRAPSSVRCSNPLKS